MVQSVEYLYEKTYIIMPDYNNTPLLVSALIIVRKEKGKPTEILNVLAHNKSKYGFPGGKLEEGESPKNAVIRETIEELNTTPTNIKYLATYGALTPEGRNIKMFVFSGKISGEIKPSNEIKEFHWLSYDQMINNINLLTPITIDHVLPLLKSL